MFSRDLKRKNFFDQLTLNNESKQQGRPEAFISLSVLLVTFFLFCGGMKHCFCLRCHCDQLGGTKRREGGPIPRKESYLVTHKAEKRSDSCKRNFCSGWKAMKRFLDRRKKQQRTKEKSLGRNAITFMAVAGCFRRKISLGFSFFKKIKVTNAGNNCVERGGFRHRRIACLVLGGRSTKRTRRRECSDMGKEERACLMFSRGWRKNSPSNV